MSQGYVDPDWHDFYKKFVNEAVHELAPNRQGVDFELTQKFVKGSPKEAQITVQILWREYLELKEAGNEMYKDCRLHLCSLAAAHMFVFGYEGTKILFDFCKGLDDELYKFMEEMNLT